MKEIRITPKQQKRELRTFLICLLIAFISNVYAIIKYQSPATELYSSLHYVLLFSIFLYVAWALIRFIAGFITGILKK
ncbi:MAG: hypothetical protein RBT57_06610 [Paludibacter sp.]|jgi:hypothetical protein|nr:hypothetical protein [Paludibacter sp.]